MGLKNMADGWSLFCFLLITVVHVMSNPVNPVTTEPPIPALDDSAAEPFNIPVDENDQHFSCQKNEDCTTSILGSESHCVGTNCHCVSGASQSPQSKKCLYQRDTLGSGCEEDWQCTNLLGDYTQCSSHTCSCKPGASVVNGKCWIQIPLGGTCQNNEECVGGSDSLCTDHVCACISSKVPHPDNTHCLPVAQQVGDPCTEAIQCTTELGDGSSCNNNKCTCLKGYHTKNNACVKNLILDDKCTNVDGECFLEDSFGLDRVNCHDTCKCKDTFVPSIDKTKCLEKGQPDPGPGGAAANIAPLFTIILSVILARLAAS